MRGAYNTAAVYGTDIGGSFIHMQLMYAYYTTREKGKLIQAFQNIFFIRNYDYNLVVWTKGHCWRYLEAFIIPIL